MKKTLFVIYILFICISCKENATNPDPYENVSVIIASQTWMTVNLDVDRYKNGDTIPEVKDAAVWATLTTGAWCYYNNDPALGKIYGRLYNWYAVNDPRGIAPAGWHVATDAEWTSLVYYASNNSKVGGYLKEKDTLHWKSPNAGAANVYKFTAMPGGSRDGNGIFRNITEQGIWWTATTSVTDSAWSRSVVYDTTNVNKLAQHLRMGFSVRCIKD